MNQELRQNLSLSLLKEGANFKNKQTNEFFVFKEKREINFQTYVVLSAKESSAVIVETPLNRFFDEYIYVTGAG